MDWAALIPLAIITISGLLAMVFIVVIGQIIKARVSAVSKSSFVKLATELKEENSRIFTELTAMKQDIASINKMMKEIE